MFASTRRQELLRLLLRAREDEHELPRRLRFLPGDLRGRDRGVPRGERAVALRLGRRERGRGLGRERFAVRVRLRHGRAPSHLPSQSQRRERALGALREALVQESVVVVLSSARAADPRDVLRQRGARLRGARLRVASPTRPPRGHAGCGRDRRFVEPELRGETLPRREVVKRNGRESHRGVHRGGHPSVVRRAENSEDVPSRRRRERRAARRRRGVRSNLDMPTSARAYPNKSTTRPRVSRPPVRRRGFATRER
eukprot:29239-Pelagococcus_subviridis.AAC.8